ncbi:MAG: 50S ribosomal protein L10, partial [Candidatus Binatia bacterium]
MRKQEKAELVAELGEKLRTAKVTLLARYQGLSVAKTTQFRREVRGVKGECKVAKNTLAKRAFAASLPGSDAWLEGPTAL